jgi:hypothetical protein
MKETNEQNEKNLNEFLEFCQTDIEFIEIQTFANSVKVYFDKAILCLYFEKLNKINHKYFVYRTQITDCESICLFIYKKKCYEFH